MGVRDVVSGVTLLLAVGAFVLALTADRAPAPTTTIPPTTTNDDETRRLLTQVERQQRRIGDLESRVSDLEDQVQSLRPRGGFLPSSSTASSGMRALGMPAPDPVAADAVAMAITLDAGTPEAIRAVVEQALKAERDREAEERKANRVRQQSRWLDDLEKSLGLTSSQKEQMKAIAEWVDDRRTELGRQMRDGEIPRSQMRSLFDSNRQQYEERVKSVLTQQQYEDFMKLDEMDRRPPMGPRFRRFD